MPMQFFSFFSRILLDCNSHLLERCKNVHATVFFFCFPPSNTLSLISFQLSLPTLLTLFPFLYILLPFDSLLITLSLLSLLFFSPYLLLLFTHFFLSSPNLLFTVNQLVYRQGSQVVNQVDSPLLIHLKNQSPLLLLILVNNKSLLTHILHHSTPFYSIPFY